MEKYIIAPPAGSQTNALGAKDRPWEEVHANRYPGINEYLAESTGYGIVSGCEPSINGLTVTVGAGVIHTADGRRIEVSEQSITLDTADSSGARKDIVYIDSNCVLQKSTGAVGASTNNGEPVLPDKAISVAMIYLSAGATTGPLLDERNFKPDYQKLGWINVKDFGATGDGETNDLKSIQNALDYAANLNVYPHPESLTNRGFGTGGATVFFPRGHYYLGTGTLKLNILRVSVVGFDAYIRGGNASKPVMIANGAAATKDGNLNHLIEGISFRNSAGGDALQIGNELTNATEVGCQFKIYRCTFGGTVSDHADILVKNNAYIVDVDSCISSSSGGAFIKQHGTSNSGERMLIRNCMLYGCSIGFDLSSSSADYYIDGCSFDNYENVGMFLKADSSVNVYISKCHIEQSYTRSATDYLIQLTGTTTYTKIIVRDSAVSIMNSGTDLQYWFYCSNDNTCMYFENNIFSTITKLPYLANTGATFFKNRVTNPEAIVMPLANPINLYSEFNIGPDVTKADDAGKPSIYSDNGSRLDANYLNYARLTSTNITLSRLWYGNRICYRVAKTGTYEAAIDFATKRAVLDGRMILCRIDYYIPSMTASGKVVGFLFGYSNGITHNMGYYTYMAVKDTDLKVGEWGSIYMHTYSNINAYPSHDRFVVRMEMEAGISIPQMYVRPIATPI